MVRELHFEDGAVPTKKLWWLLVVVTVPGFAPRGANSPVHLVAPKGGGALRVVGCVRGSLVALAGARAEL